MSQPSDSAPSTHAPSDAQPEYNQQERALLLQWAHQAILARLERRQLEPHDASGHLTEPRGVFTTLYWRDKLRGCVGYPLATVPLYRAVMETAQSAAFDDPRFHPVSREEAPELKISLSVLSPMTPITPQKVEVGRHGLLISDGARRGLLLPQVPVEHGWDRVTFLDQTCKKAGLPLDAWRHGAKIEAFTAEVFGEGDGPSPEEAE